jgi:hypothetical protein
MFLENGSRTCWCHTWGRWCDLCESQYSILVPEPLSYRDFWTSQSKNDWFNNGYPEAQQGTKVLIKKNKQWTYFCVVLILMYTNLLNIWDHDIIAF